VFSSKLSGGTVTPRRSLSPTLGFGCLGVVVVVCGFLELLPLFFFEALSKVVEESLAVGLEPLEFLHSLKVVVVVVVVVLVESLEIVLLL